MFNVGGGELIVILLLALIVLGPARLPDAARQIGKAMADLRRISNGFQNEVRSALDVADDTDHVTARRNVLAKEEPSGAPPEPPHPVRTEPLVAGPGLEPRLHAAAPAPEPEPEVTRRPSAQARAAAKKEASAKGAPPSPASATKKAAARNGTPVKKAKAAGKSSSTAARRDKG